MMMFHSVTHFFYSLISCFNSFDGANEEEKEKDRKNLLFVLRIGPRERVREQASIPKKKQEKPKELIEFIVLCWETSLKESTKRKRTARWR